MVTFGQVNHRDLRIMRSTDGGRTWSEPIPFPQTRGRTYYPGSLTTLGDGRMVHAWNRWSQDDNEQEPRSVAYAVSDDEGLTWGEPRPLPAQPAPAAAQPRATSVIRHPLVELDDDAWLVSLTDRTLLFRPTSGEAAPWADGRSHGLVPIVRTPSGAFISGAGLRSVDDGATWMPIDDFPDLKSQGWRHELVCLREGLLLASEILGPGFGGERIRYALSRDDGLTWTERFEYHAPGRAIGGRACPRTVRLDAETIGVVYYDISEEQPGGPGLFFARIPLALLAAE